MNELSSKIITVLNKQGKKGIAFRDLEHKLKIKNKRVKELRIALEELESEGKILQKKNRVVSTAQTGCLAAEIVRVNRTFGFAKTLDEDCEYFIPGKFLLGSLPGDIVLIRKIPGRGDSPEGEVVRIIRQGTGEFTGRIVIEDGRYAIEPDVLMKQTLPLKKSELNGAKEGDKVLARISSRGKRHCEHRAEIVSTYGDAETAASCSKAVLDLNGISEEFPYEVLDKARYLQKRGIKDRDYLNRIDLRGEIIFTIDGADSKDLDDAVSLVKYDDCYQLGVHIADVSHYVQYKSDIDKEAFIRGTSIYYADKVIPMLPRELSNGICSLNPHEDRLALSALLTLDLEGNLIDFDFQKTVICSRVKGVYSEVNELLSGKADEKILKKYEMVADTLFLMKELADLRTAKKRQRGAPEIVTRESKIITDEMGKAVDIKPRVSGAAEVLIEEFMLLANEAAAMAGKMKELPFVYRVHEGPTPEKMEKLNTTLRLLGLQSRDLSANVKPKALAEILKKAKDTKYDSIVNIQVLRAMSKAKYSENPIGHYGLALENYAHFTSPIRRYSDLEVHRVLTEVLEDRPLEEIRRKYHKFAPKAAAQASQTEMTAMKIERECEDCYKAEYMKEYIGEEFEGMISSVAQHGIYVELPNTIEGLVRREDLPDGEYFFDELMSFKNLTTGQVFRIGDQVTVQCIKSDVNSGNIDFMLKTK